MPDFDTWRYNNNLLEQVKKLRKANVDPDTNGKVAIGIQKTVFFHQKKKFKNWVKYLHKELSFTY